MNKYLHTVAFVWILRGVIYVLHFEVELNYGRTFNQKMVLINECLRPNATGRTVKVIGGSTVVVKICINILAPSVYIYIYI